MKSKSNLLNYISHLMQNDEALHKFTIDPITTSEKEHVWKPCVYYVGEAPIHETAA